MVCRGFLPVTIDFYGLTATPLAPQRVVGYRPTRFFLLRLSGIKDIYPMSFSKKSIVGRDGLAPLPADTLGTGFRMRCSAPTTSPLSRPVRAEARRDDWATNVTTGPIETLLPGRKLRLTRRFETLARLASLAVSKDRMAKVRWTGSDSETSPHYRASVPQAFLPASVAYLQPGRQEWWLVSAP